MANWTAKLTAAILDPVGNNANIQLTITLTNTVTSEVQTRLVTGSNFTVNSIKAMGEAMIAALVIRDSTLVTAVTAIGGSGVIIATG